MHSSVCVVVPVCCAPFFVHTRAERSVVSPASPGVGVLVVLQYTLSSSRSSCQCSQNTETRQTLGHRSKFCRVCCVHATHSSLVAPPYFLTPALSRSPSKTTLKRSCGSTRSRATTEGRGSRGNPRTVRTTVEAAAVAATSRTTCRTPTPTSGAPQRRPAPGTDRPGRRPTRTTPPRWPRRTTPSPPTPRFAPCAAAAAACSPARRPPPSPTRSPHSPPRGTTRPPRAESHRGPRRCNPVAAFYRRRGRADRPATRRRRRRFGNNNNTTRLR